MQHSSSTVINRDITASQPMLAAILAKADAATNGIRNILVRETFMTWQGEMPLTGRRAFFIRLGGCNRGAKIDKVCAACDTSFEIHKSKAIPLNEVALQYMKHALPSVAEKSQIVFSELLNLPMVVITGGEPLLQSDRVVELIHTLQCSIYNILCSALPDTEDRSDYITMPLFQIETNGDYIAAFINDLQRSLSRIKDFEAANSQFSSMPPTRIVTVVSPKAPSEGVIISKMTELELHRSSLISGYSTSEGNISRQVYSLAFCIRRVISTEEPYNTLSEGLLTWNKNATEERLAPRLSGVKPSADQMPIMPVYLSPTTVWRVLTPDGKPIMDHRASQACAARAIELAKEHSLPLSLQTHVYLGVE